MTKIGQKIDKNCTKLRCFFCTFSVSILLKFLRLVDWGGGGTAGYAQQWVSDWNVQIVRLRFEVSWPNSVYGQYWLTRITTDVTLEKFKMATDRHLENRFWDVRSMATVVWTIKSGTVCSCCARKKRLQQNGTRLRARADKWPRKVRADVISAFRWPLNHTAKLPTVATSVTSTSDGSISVFKNQYDIGIY